jgi:methyltransferase (TIGR00027 family)
VTDLAGSGPARVGQTALGAAMVRAMESRRPDRLFLDPYAAAFLAAVPEVFRRAERGAVACLSGLSRTGARFWSKTVIRTRFFDDYLVSATGLGVRQVVLVAAGLDTRAYRLAWPVGVVVFELDFTDVLAFKRQVLARLGAVPRCDRRPVPADLREDWDVPLAGAGLRAGQPVAWLLEGLLIYLSAAETGRLLDLVTDLSAAGSRIAFEFDEAGAPALRQQASGLPAVARYSELWKGGLPDAPDWLAARGWLIDRHDDADVTAGYGRSPAGPDGGGFVTGTRT